MTLGQLQTFAAVARLGSLTAAARELAVSVPAVSAALATLRRELGDELVVRRAAGVSLTPGGHRLAAAAAEILGIAETARRAVREARGDGALLRLAATHEVAEYAAGPLLEAFSRTRPNLEVAVTAAAGDDLAGLLRDRRADATLGPPLAGVTGVDDVPFLRARAIVVAAPGHALAGRRLLGPGALRGQRWLAGPAASDPLTAVGELVERYAVAAAEVVAFPSQAAALAAVAVGQGLGAAVGHTVLGELRRGTLVQLDVAGTPLERLWHAAFLSADRRPALASALRRFVVTPEAMHAILTRSGGGTARRFRPPVHVTIWN